MIAFLVQLPVYLGITVFISCPGADIHCVFSFIEYTHNFFFLVVIYSPFLYTSNLLVYDLSILYLSPFFECDL